MSEKQGRAYGYFANAYLQLKQGRKGGCWVESEIS
jgi:hypothetical protein